MDVKFKLYRNSTVLTFPVTVTVFIPGSIVIAFDIRCKPGVTVIPLSKLSLSR